METQNSGNNPDLGSDVGDPVEAGVQGAYRQDYQLATGEWYHYPVGTDPITEPIHRGQRADCAIELCHPKPEPAGEFIQVGDCPVFHSCERATHTEFHPGEEPECQICHPVNRWREAFEGLVEDIKNAIKDCDDTQARVIPDSIRGWRLEGSSKSLRSILQAADVRHAAAQGDKGQNHGAVGEEPGEDD